MTFVIVCTLTINLIGNFGLCVWFSWGINFPLLLTMPQSRKYLLQLNRNTNTVIRLRNITNASTADKQQIAQEEHRVSMA